MTTNSRSACGTLGLATLVAASVAMLAGCPPNLTGEPCNNDCACPTSQTCMAIGPSPNSSVVATCQDGVNTCDAGSSPDAGPDGGQPAFAGVVEINGGAPPANGVEMYGYANGSLTNTNGVYVGADLSQVTMDGGAFAFSLPVPPAYDGGYRFAAVYNTKNNGDLDTSDPGVLATTTVTSLTPGSSAALTMHIDVQTSTCYSVTIDAPELDDQTFLLGVGALIYDIHTGALRTQASDLNVATATFDAGSPLPADFVPLGTVNLQPTVGSVPDSPISNSWIYTPDSGAAPISDEGAFFFSLNDALNPPSQYPAGYCVVTYAPPPGFPSNLSLNDGGAVWGGLGSGPKNQTVVSWQDSQGVLPDGFSLLGDFISLNDPNGVELYNPGHTVTSPFPIDDNTVPVGACDSMTKSKCTLRVTSLYQDGRREHSTAYEGGMTTLSFQRALGASPGG